MNPQANEPAGAPPEAADGGRVWTAFREFVTDGAVIGYAYHIRIYSDGSGGIYREFGVLASARWRTLAEAPGVIEAYRIRLRADVGLPPEAHG